MWEQDLPLLIAALQQNKSIANLTRGGYFSSESFDFLLNAAQAHPILQVVHICCLGDIHNDRGHLLPDEEEIIRRAQGTLTLLSNNRRLREWELGWNIEAMEPPQELSVLIYEQLLFNRQQSNHSLECICQHMRYKARAKRIKMHESMDSRLALLGCALGRIHETHDQEDHPRLDWVFIKYNVNAMYHSLKTNKRKREEDRN